MLLGWLRRASADARAKAPVFAHLQVVMHVSFLCVVSAPFLSLVVNSIRYFCYFINFNSIYTIAVQFP